MEMGQPFGVAYEEKMMYRDPEHRSLFLIAKAEITVSHPNRTGDESGIKFVTIIVNSELSDRLHAISDEKKSYKELPACFPALAEACAAKLTEEGYTVHGFNILSMELDPKIKEAVERMEMMKSMTPEDIGRKMAEAQQAAMQAVQAQQTAVPTYPKFCPNCGTPTTGTNFCPNCGMKLR